MPFFEGGTAMTQEERELKNALIVVTIASVVAVAVVIIEAII